MSEIYSISSTIYYDNNKESYYPIIIINKYPLGKLSSLIKNIKLDNLSPFSNINDNRCNSKCIYAIKSIHCNNELMCLDEIDELYQFLLTNNYIIDYQFTNLINDSKNNHINKKKLIMYIKYNQ
jgi:hypothetical protein